MRNKKDSRKINEWKEVSPWENEDTDSTDFIRHCCVKNLTRMAKPPQKGKRKNNNQKLVSDETVLQREERDRKAEFVQKLCPSIGDKTQFLLEFNFPMERDGEEEQIKTEERNKKPTKTNENQVQNEITKNERKPFKEKTSIRRARSGDVVQTSLFDQQRADVQRSRSTQSWKGEIPYKKYSDLSERIDEKVRWADQQETSKHIWELADLICKTGRDDNKMNDAKSLLALNQELVSDNIAKINQLYSNNNKSDPFTDKDLEMEEKMIEQKDLKTKDRNSKSLSKRPLNKIMVVLPSIGYSGTTNEIDEDNFNNFPLLPTFKMIVNDTKPSSQNLQQQLIEVAGRNTKKEKANVQAKSVNFPRLNVEPHNLPVQTKPLETVVKYQNLKPEVIDSGESPVSNQPCKDGLAKGDSSYLSSTRYYWNGSVGSLYSKSKHSFSNFPEPARRTNRKAPPNKHLQLKIENLLFLK